MSILKLEKYLNITTLVKQDFFCKCDIPNITLNYNIYFIYNNQFKLEFDKVSFNWTVSSISSNTIRCNICYKQIINYTNNNIIYDINISNMVNNQVYIGYNNMDFDKLYSYYNKYVINNKNNIINLMFKKIFKFKNLYGANLIIRDEISYYYLINNFIVKKNLFKINRICFGSLLKHFPYKKLGLKFYKFIKKIVFNKYKLYNICKNKGFIIAKKIIASYRYDIILRFYGNKRHNL